MAASSLTSRLPAIIARSGPGVEAAVDLTLRRVRDGARRRARVDTGEMRRKLQDRKTGRFSGVVEGLADHTIFNEFGTRYMSAQPMLVPAAEENRQAFRRMVREAWLP